MYEIEYCDVVAHTQKLDDLYETALELYLNNVQDPVFMVSITTPQGDVVEATIDEGKSMFWADLAGEIDDAHLRI